MNWLDALDLVIARTGHRRFRELCAEEASDAVAWRREMVRLALTPRPPTVAVDYGTRPPTPCCG